MKLKMIAITLLATAALTACSAGNTNEESSSKATQTQDIKQLVHEYSVGNKKAASASITSQQLTVTDSGGNKTVYKLPEDEFFVSIAPYISETHPWTNHSLTGCQGELANKEFDVYIEDTEGNVIVDDTLKSQANGFIDLWLPRGKTYRTKFEYDGKMVEAELSTSDNDPTCITTMQLM